MKLSVITTIIWLFGIDMQVYQCEKMLPDVAHTTVIEWFRKFRGICPKTLKEDPLILGGALSGNVIEIDESLFGKKRKYHVHCKYKCSKLNGHDA